MFKNVSPHCVLYVLNTLLHCDDVKRDSKKKICLVLLFNHSFRRINIHHQCVYIHVQMEEKKQEGRECAQQRKTTDDAGQSCSLRGVCVLNTAEKSYRTHYTHTHTRCFKGRNTHSNRDIKCAHASAELIGLIHEHYQSCMQVKAFFSQCILVCVCVCVLVKIEL